MQSTSIITNQYSSAYASAPASTYKSTKAETTADSDAVQDSYTPSGKTPTTDATQDSKKSAFQDFDMEAFQAEIRDKLLEQIKSSKEAIKSADTNNEIKWVSDVPYAVDATQQAADVPEEYNADNTSQRIVDFALQFRSQATGLTDEEFIKQVKDAVSEGFRQAKHDVGDLPSASAKLFNDTYQATMDKLDKALTDWQSQGGWSQTSSTTQPSTSTSTTKDAPASKPVFSVAA